MASQMLGGCKDVGEASGSMCMCTNSSADNLEGKKCGSGKPEVGNMQVDKEASGSMNMCTNLKYTFGMKSPM